jgi:uncharacterized membrane protein
MPFLSLDNGWSNLAKYYNQSFNNKPEVPTFKYTAFDDGLIRGGVINATLASTRDTARIGKFFASGKGALFITKQVGLQLSNPLLEQEVPTDTFGKLGTNTKSNLLNNIAGSVNTSINAINSFINQKSPNQIYNLGLNTLAQIPLVSAGGHIIRQGILPIGGGGYLNNSTDNIKGYNYEKIVKDRNNQTIESIKSQQSSNIVLSTVQSLFNLQNAVVSSVTSYHNSPNRLLNYLDKIATVSTGKNKSFSVELQTYNGGPNSVYGIGKTIISTSPSQRTDITDREDDPKANLLNGFPTDAVNSFVGYKNIDITSNDYSSDRKEKVYIKSDDNRNIEDRIGVSKIGGKRNNTNRSVDSINVISIIDSKTFYDNSDSAKKSNNEVSNLLNGNKDVDGFFGRDIIKFRLEFLNNNTNAPEILTFRAYIDDFNDGMTSRWNSYRYIGRGEDFYVYDGFTRDISVAFTMYAHSPAEMKPLYQKLDYLMSTFTPDYSAANKMRGNIGYLTVGDYIYRQPGIFTDIKLSGMLDTHWEIALNDPENNPEDAKQYEIPKHIKIGLSFKPIHNFLPRRSSLGKEGTPLDKVPFITRNNIHNPEGKNKYLTV